MLIVSSAIDKAAASAAMGVCEILSARGVTCFFPTEDLSRISGLVDNTSQLKEYVDETVEMAIVLGGDGSILRAAEVLRQRPAPILGVNLGHVGFMAEAEKEDINQALDSVMSGRFSVRERTTLNVSVWQGEKEVFKSWALNEVAVEKSSRERMIEVVLEVEKRPLSSFGCDGVLVSTATGSTAYAFSAGGPIVWPNVDAFVVVPISAHALFARPFVIDNDSSVAIEVLQRSAGGVISCDGRRTYELEPGARVEISRGSQSVEMVTLSEEPFADRLVRKFNLPVSGWRGPGSGA
ncbi:MAG: NAD kinase [Actinobacteria bacterium]|nr:NAD kinase [Actinomycetota bacterium]MTA90325.1 NAD kinase [Actinomycetota bacterium]